MCVEELPRLKEIEAEFRERGLAIIGISLDDDLEDFERMVAEHDIRWPQIRDGESGETVKLYHMLDLPAFVLIDGAGKIVERFHYLNYSPETDLLDEVEKRLEELLGS